MVKFDGLLMDKSGGRQAARFQQPGGYKIQHQQRAAHDFESEDVLCATPNKNEATHHAAWATPVAGARDQHLYAPNTIAAVTHLMSNWQRFSHTRLTNGSGYFSEFGLCFAVCGSIGEFFADVHLVFRRD